MNKIIQSSRFKKKSVWNEWMLTKKTVSFDEDISRTWSTSTSGVIGANDSVENYEDLFTVVLRTDDIHEFDSRKWDEFFLSMTQKPIDEIQESLYKFGMRKFEKLNQDRLWMTWRFIKRN